MFPNFHSDLKNLVFDNCNISLDVASVSIFTFPVSADKNTTMENIVFYPNCSIQLLKSNDFLILGTPMNTTSPTLNCSNIQCGGNLVLG